MTRVSGKGQSWKKGFPIVTLRPSHRDAIRPGDPICRMKDEDKEPRVITMEEAEAEGLLRPVQPVVGGFFNR